MIAHAFLFAKKFSFCFKFDIAHAFSVVLCVFINVVCLLCRSTQQGHNTLRICGNFTLSVELFSWLFKFICLLLCSFSCKDFQTKRRSCCWQQTSFWCVLRVCIRKKNHCDPCLWIHSWYYQTLYTGYLESIQEPIPLACCIDWGRYFGTFLETKLRCVHKCWTMYWSHLQNEWFERFGENFTPTYSTVTKSCKFHMKVPYVIIFFSRLHIVSYFTRMQPKVNGICFVLMHHHSLLCFVFWFCFCFLFLIFLSVNCSVSFCFCLFCLILFLLLLSYACSAWFVLNFWVLYFIFACTHAYMFA